MSGPKPLTFAQRKTNRDYNHGFKDAYEDTGRNEELYVANEAYRRGYDAGEDLRDEDVLNGDYDPPTPDQIKQVYGDPKDLV